MNSKQAYTIINRAIELIETGERTFSCLALIQAVHDYRVAAHARQETFHDLSITRMYTYFTRAHWLHVQTNKLSRMGWVKRVLFALRGGHIPDLPYWWNSGEPHVAKRVAALKDFRSMLVMALA